MQRSIGNKAWLTINRECNLRCSWCYAQSRGYDNSLVIRNEAIERSLKLFKELQIYNVFVIGGEPTMHQDVCGIVSLIKSSGFNVSLITNGLKFCDVKFLNDLVDAGLDMVGISLKGCDQDKYEKVTRFDYFESAMVAIGNVCKSKVSHDISVTVSNEDVESFTSLLQDLKKMDVKRLSIDVERPFFDSKTICDVDESLAIKARMLECLFSPLENCGVEYVFNVRMPFFFFSGGFVEKLIQHGRIVSGCQLIGGNGIIIDTNANVLPCNQMHEYPLGQLGVDFATGDDYLAFRKRKDIDSFYKAMNACPNAKCVDCQYWSYCGAGCRFYWFRDSGNNLLHNSIS